MSLELLNIVEIIEVMENYLARVRPPEHIRDKLDISYNIENQSIVLNEVRPIFPKPGEIAEYGYAKATYVKTENLWKIYWMRASGKWELYHPAPTAKTLSEFLRVVDEDSRGCFHG
jgi:hypothetical protein